MIYQVLTSATIHTYGFSYLSDAAHSHIVPLVLPFLWAPDLPSPLPHQEIEIPPPLDLDRLVSHLWLITYSGCGSVWCPRLGHTQCSSALGSGIPTLEAFSCVNTLTALRLPCCEEVPSSPCRDHIVSKAFMKSGPAKHLVLHPSEVQLHRGDSRLEEPSHICEFLPHRTMRDDNMIAVLMGY